MRADGTNVFKKLLPLVLTGLGWVSSVRAADPAFQRTGSIALNAADKTFYFLALDTAAGFGYVGCATTPPQILKIRLSDRVKVASLPIVSGTPNAQITSLVLDPGRDFGYAGLATFPGKVVRFRLSTMAAFDSLTVGAASETAGPLAADDARQFAYLGLGSSQGKLVKIDLNTFSVAAQVTLPSGAQGLSHLLVDAARGGVYGVYSQFADHLNYEPLVKFSTSTLAIVSTVTWSFTTGSAVVRSAALDSAGGYAYFGMYRSPFEISAAAIVRVRLSDFVEDGTLSLNAGEHNIAALALDPASGSGYFPFSDNGQFSSSPNKIGRFHLSSFTLDTPVIGAGFTAALAVDAPRNQIVGVTATNPGYMYWISHPAFSNVEATHYDSGEGDLRAAAIDPAGGFAYFGSYTVPGRVIRVDLATRAKSGAIDLPTGDGVPSSMVVDPGGGMAYLGTESLEGGVGGGIIQIQLSNFSRVDFLTLLAGENNLTKAAIDTSRGFAYFGTSSVPAKFVKVDLNPFQRAGGITLNNDESPIAQILVDTAANRGYIVTAAGSGQGKIIVVNLNNMTRIDEAPLHAVVNSPPGAAMDGTYIYTMLHGYPTSIARIRKDTLAMDSFTFFASTAGTGPVLYDGETGYVYFGMSPTQTSNGLPMTVQRVRASDFTPAGSISGIEFEAMPRSVVLDPLRGYAYYGMGTDQGRIMVVQVQDPLAGIPPAPAGAAILSVGTGTLAASWNASLDASTYTFLASANSVNPPNPVNGSTTTAALSATVGSGLSPNTTYYLFVNACNGAGCSAYTVFGPTATLAAVPTLSAGTIGTTTAGLVIGAGGNPAGTTYLVEQQTGGAGPFSVVLTTTSLTCTVSGLSAGTNYAFEVRAVNRSGIQTNVSNPVMVVTAPPAPGAGSITNATATGLTASWGASSGAATYTLAASVNSGNPPSPVNASNSPSGTSGSLAGLTPNTTYFAFVNACNGGGCSGYVSLGSTLTLAAIPANLAAAAVAGTSVQLIFSANGNPAGTIYIIQRSDDGGTIFNTVSTGTALGATIGGLTPGSSYVFHVIARDKTGRLTAPSSPITVTAVFGGGDVFSFPNPFKPGQGTLTFRNLPPTKTFMILTLRGTEVRTLTADGAGQTAWDGRDEGGTFVTSGVYLGVPEGKKVFKFAVER